MAGCKKVDLLVNSFSKVPLKLISAQKIPLITSTINVRGDAKAEQSAEISSDGKHFNDASSENIEEVSEKEKISTLVGGESSLNVIETPKYSCVKVSEPAKKCEQAVRNNGENLSDNLNNESVPSKKQETRENDLHIYRGACSLPREVEESGSASLISHVQEALFVEARKSKKNPCSSSDETNDDIREAEYASEIYIKGDILNVSNDNTHAIRDHIVKIREISYFTTAKLICSMLNTATHSVIYFGVNRNGTIRGLPINREQRDSFRCGIDNIMTAQIKPRLLPSNYKIKFVSVFRIYDIDPEVPLSPNQNFYVVEIHIYPSPYTLYKLADGDTYLRKNGETVKATFCDVRLWVASMEEQRNLPQIQLLRKVTKTMKTLKYGKSLPM